MCCTVPNEGSLHSAEVCHASFELIGMWWMMRWAILWLVSGEVCTLSVRERCSGGVYKWLFRERASSIWHLSSRDEIIVLAYRHENQRLMWYFGNFSGKTIFEIF